MIATWAFSLTVPEVLVIFGISNSNIGIVILAIASRGIWRCGHDLSSEKWRML